MSRTIQVRDVPETVHEALTARASAAGLSLSEYLRQELERIVARPGRRELLERVAARARADTLDAATVAAAVRAERDAR